MKQPFFSVVIPTKDRPELLRDAISSVLLQDFQDYELIVSDNFNDERTKKVVDEFAADSHLKYFYTEQELNMPDHWEFATLKARGKYVLILSDRSLLRQGALKKIHQTIQNFSSEISVYSWQHLIFEPQTKLLRATSKVNNKVKVFSTKQLIKEYEKSHKIDYSFPVGVNCCYKEKFVAEIRKKHGRLFWPINPDVVSCFLLLYYAQEIACFGESLSIMQKTWNSTGVLRDAHGPEFYLKTLRLNNWYHYVPIKAPFTHNLAFSDYLTARTMVSGEQNFADINWVTYFLKCYEEFVYFGKFGFIRERKEEFLREWKKALSSFDKNTQALVRKKIKWLKILFTIKAFLVKSPFLHLLRKIQNRVEFGYLDNKSYASALEVAGFNKEIFFGKIKNSEL